MPGLFGVLDIASRGLMVNQRGIQVAGHNIANAATEGYSTQRQVLAPALPLPRRDGTLGTGVEQVTIERMHDAFVEAQLLLQGSNHGSTSAQSQALDLIEGALNEQSGDGLTAALSRLYDAFSDLASASEPGAPVEREVLRSEAQALIDTLAHIDAQLRDFQRSADQSIRDTLPRINDLTAGIHELNVEIARAEVTAPANDLRDRRDALVRELAGLIDVRTFEQDSGALVVTLASGHALVEGNSARTLTTQADATNPFDASFVRVMVDDGSGLSDVTGAVGGGQLGGLLRARDTLHPSAIRSLDTVAYNLAVSVNAVHSGGIGLDGTVGDFFVAPAAVEDAARNLALDPSIVASADAIAAGLTTAPGDNENALALAALRDASAPLHLPGDPPGPASGPTRSVLAHLATVVGDVGQQARSMQLARQQQTSILEGLQNRRDEVAGVNVDEEVTRLIQLQAAFQANSRVISVVNQLLQDVVDLL